MKRLLNVINSEVSDFKENGAIGYFFDSYEEYLAYKPFINFMTVLGLIILFVSLICL